MKTIATVLVLFATAVRAEELPDRVRVMAGLSQWILFRGGNAAIEIDRGRFALEISHGQGLDLNQAGGLFLSSAERDASMRVRVPWTTGSAWVTASPTICTSWSNSRPTASKCSAPIATRRPRTRRSASGPACST